jgi:large subunit ribosomal protein L1
MAAKGKRFKKAEELVEAKEYSLSEACKLIEKFPKPKFDESVDVVVSLGVDPRKAEENVRGTVALPHGRGKTVRVAAFCKGDKQKDATEAGADFVGADDLIAKIQGGWLDFDAAVATPDMMGMVGKIGKLLGPRGLMPNPKVGTVAVDIASAVKAIKSGRVEFRVEKAGLVHCGVARVSFGAVKIEENINALLESLVKAKPKTSKGIYMKKIHLSTTMGPGIELDPSPFRQSAV